MAGPKSEPPIPMFTISVNGFPVNPFLSPEIISFEKFLILFFTSKLLALHFFHQQKQQHFLALNAVCKTALFSV
jgi:hypothetical protein